jgi:acyl-CoA thioesterase I
MGVMLSSITLWFAGGASLYWGLGIAQAVCVTAVNPDWRRTRWALDALAVFGIVLAVLSAAPMPVWLYAVWIASVLALLAIAHTSRRPYGPLSQALILLSAGALVVMVSGELQQRRIPRLALTDTKILYVIGDSLSINADDPEAGWPQLTAAQIGAALHTYSSKDLTVASAVAEAEKVVDPSAEILLQVGGHDIASGTGPAAFRDGLESLLNALRGSNREMVMFELPLPPFKNAYGRIQREAAARYNVTLIPKRVTARILRRDGANLRELELSPEGHQRLADAVIDMYTPKRVKKMSWEGF